MIFFEFTTRGFWQKLVKIWRSPNMKYKYLSILSRKDSGLKLPLVLGFASQKTPLSDAQTSKLLGPGDTFLTFVGHLFGWRGDSHTWNLRRQKFTSLDFKRFRRSFGIFLLISTGPSATSPVFQLLNCSFTKSGDFLQRSDWDHGKGKTKSALASDEFES